MKILTQSVVATGKAKYVSKKHGQEREISYRAALESHGEFDPAYFSITGEIGHPRASDCDCCGCIHDEISRHFPKLKPLVELHLSDIDGIPMHAQGNGWYFMAGALGGFGEKYHAANGMDAKTPERCLEIFSELTRISLTEAQALAQTLRQMSPGRAKTHFEGWIEAQKPRWKIEAQSGLALLQELAK